MQNLTLQGLGQQPSTGSPWRSVGRGPRRWWRPTVSVQAEREAAAKKREEIRGLVLYASSLGHRRYAVQAKTLAEAWLRKYGGRALTGGWRDVLDVAKLRRQAQELVSELPEKP